MISIDKIKKLRQETSISIIECKKALEQTKGDLEKAKAILQKKGIEFAAKKQEREAKTGIIESYIHTDKKKGVLLNIQCETDFVAKNEEFQKLAHEICLHIVAMDSESINVLLEEPWIKDQDKKIKDLISEHIAKLGENIVIEKFIRYEI